MDLQDQYDAARKNLRKVLDHRNGLPTFCERLAPHKHVWYPRTKKEKKTCRQNAAFIYYGDSDIQRECDFDTFIRVMKAQGNICKTCMSHHQSNMDMRVAEDAVLHAKIKMKLAKEAAQ